MKKMLIATVLAAASLNAFADGGYIGGGAGQGKVDFTPISVAPASLTSEDTDQSYKVFLGAEIGDVLAIELGYQEMGTFSQQADLAGSSARRQYEGKAILLDLIGKLPLGDTVSLFGKVGAARTRIEVTESANGIFAGLAAPTSKHEETNLRYGAGVQFNLSKALAVRVEVERTTDVGDAATTGESDIDYMGAAIYVRL